MVAQTGNASTTFDSLNYNRQVVKYNSAFSDYAPDGINRVSVFTNEFVPFELAKKPELSQLGADKSALNITMTAEASAQLEVFSRNRIMKEVALIIDGEALTMNKIRATITGGQLQLTRCSDNVCEKLLVKINNRSSN